MKKLFILLSLCHLLSACSVSVDDENQTPAAEPNPTPTTQITTPSQVTHEDVIIEGHLVATEELLSRIAHAKRLIFRKNAQLELRDYKLDAEIETLISENGRIFTFEKNNLATPNERPLNSSPIALRIGELKGKLQVEVRGQTGAPGVDGIQGREGARGKDYVAPPPPPSTPGTSPININISPADVERIKNYFDREIPCQDYLNQFFSAQTGHAGGEGQNGFPGERGGDTGDLTIEITMGIDSLNLIYEAGLGGPGGKGGPGGLGGLYGNVEASAIAEARCQFKNLRAPQGPNGLEGPRGYPGKKGISTLNGKEI